MSILVIADLAADAEREFRAVLGHNLVVKLSETFFESSFRGGFRVVLVDAKRSFEILYSDMQFEVRFNDREVFGKIFHEGFEGNMFSREHLREYLPRIVASTAAQVRANAQD